MFFAKIRKFACVVTDELKSAPHDYITFNPTIQLNSLKKSSRFTLVLRQVFYSLCGLRSIFAIICSAQSKCLSQALPFSGFSDLLKQDNPPGFDVPVRL